MRALALHAGVERALYVRTLERAHVVYTQQVHVHARTHEKAGPEHCTVSKNVARSRKHTVGELTRVFGEF